MDLARIAVSLRPLLGAAGALAWLAVVARIVDLVSCYPEKVTIAIGGETLEPVAGQTVAAHGPDRNLSIAEIGGTRLVEDAPSRPRA